MILENSLGFLPVLDFLPHHVLASRADRVNGRQMAPTRLLHVLLCFLVNLALTIVLKVKPDKEIRIESRVVIMEALRTELLVSNFVDI